MVLLSHASFTAQPPFPAKRVRPLNRYANYHLMETRERDRFNERTCARFLQHLTVWVTELQGFVSVYPPTYRQKTPPSAGVTLQQWEAVCRRAAQTCHWRCNWNQQHADEAAVVTGGWFLLCVCVLPPRTSCVWYN